GRRSCCVRSCDRVSPRRAPRPASVASMRGRRWSWTGVVLLGLALPWTRGMDNDLKDPWPVERIVENLEQRVKADPSDVEALYTPGRTHAFAFAIESATLRYWMFGEPEGARIEGLEELEWNKQLATMRPRPSPS